jgi:hypothetical protein
MVLKIFNDKPNKIFIQLLKKKVGASKYKKGSKIKHNNGKRSKKKLKKRTSAIKKIEPGKPKKTKQFIKLAKNNFGHKKFIPLISVINRLLKRLLIASTNKKELEESSAWLINMQKLANIKADWPLITHIVNQCISTTVEYATSFFKSI